MENKVEVIHRGLLQELGFEMAHSEVERKKTLKTKLMVAYEHYRYVTPQQIDDFNDKLQKNTRTTDGWVTSYDKLRFRAIKEYPNVPPANVLEDVKKARDLGCFDTFEVADIQTVEVRPDPIIFGRVSGCDNRFFISQWDNDVKLEDILKENEG